MQQPAKTFNVRMPDGTVIKNVPSGTTQTQLNEKLSSLRQNQTQEKNKQEATLGGEFAKGIGSFVDTAETFVKDVAPFAVATVTGNEEEARKQLQDMQNRQKNKPIEEVPVVQTVGDIKSVRDVALFAAGAGGQALANLGTTALGAGTGAVVGGAAAGPIGATTGLFGGALASSLPLNYTDVIQGMQEEGIDPYESFGIANSVTAAITALDVVPGLNIAKNALGQSAKKELSKSIIKRLAAQGFKSGKEEGFTEALQAVIQEGAEDLQTGKDFFTTETLNEIATNAAAGAIGGTIAGSVGQGVQEVANRKQSKTPQTNVSVDNPPSDVKVEELKSDEISPEAPATPVEPVLPETGPVTQPTEEKPVKTPSTQPVVEDLPPVEAYEPDLIERGIQKTPKEQKPLPLFEEGISAENPSRDFMNQTKIQRRPVQPQQGELDTTPGPLFNLYSNIDTTVPENKRLTDFFKDQLNLVGLDEDVMLVDISKDNRFDDTWVHPELKVKQDPETKEPITWSDYQTALEAKTGQSKGKAVTLSNGLTRPVHLIQFDPRLINSESDFVRTGSHEIGHIVTNRFVMRDPVLRNQLQDVWMKSLRDKGVYQEGISLNDINQTISAWNFNNEGEYIPDVIGLDKESFEPVKFGSKGKTDIQYMTAFDEFMAENIARWYQSSEAPRTVTEKFFKAVANIYKKFLNYAKEKGLMPAKEVDSFMNNLVAKARGKRVAEQIKQSPVEGVAMLKAYHGSPYYFEKFLLDQIGTGEGAQAFGWGLYFTNKFNIAKFYKDKLSGDLNEKMLMDKNGEKYTWKQFQDYAEIQGLLPKEKGSARTDALWGLNQAFFNMSGGYSIGTTEAESYKRILQKLGFKKPPKVQGAIYEVNIPEESEMLDWDYPVKGPILAKLNYKLMTMTLVDHPSIRAYTHSGQAFYAALIEELGSPKEASLFLNSLGIKGIKYKAGQLSTGTEDGTNYVIFDDAAIEIRKVFDDTEVLAAALRRQQNENSEQNPTYKGLPFAGYDINPKVPQALVSRLMSIRSKGILQGFAQNFKNQDNPSARTNAVQQYAIMAKALGGLDSSHLPEVYRGLLKNTQVTPDSARTTVNNDYNNNKVKEIVRDYWGVSTRDIKMRSKTETMAEAFRLYNESKRVNNPKLDLVAKTLPPAVKKVFDDMNKIVDNLKSDLNNQGIVELSDLVQGIDNDSTPSMESLMRETQINRAARRRDELENQGIVKAFVEEDQTKVGFFNQWAAPPRFIARASKLFAGLKLATDERRQAISKYQHEGMSQLEDFNKLPEEQSQFLGSIMDEQRKLKNKAYLNEDGELIYKKGDKNFILRDKDLSQTYIKTRNFFHGVARNHRRILQQQMQPLFAKAGLGFDPTRSDFDTYKEMLKDEKLKKTNTLTDGDIANLENYFETADQIGTLLNRDYIPHIRFGDRGVTVKDKGGNVVYFGTYETDTNGNALYNDQYNELMDKVKTFENNPEYKVSKDFRLTNDSIFAQLGKNKAVTIELLTQILNTQSPSLFKALEDAQSRGAFGDAQNYIEGKISHKGFMKYFKESEGVPGYSDDWKRAVASYANSSSYFLGNLDYEPKVMTAASRLQNNAKTEGLRKYGERFTNSVMSPEDNFTFMRELQYFYAMGFNPSSALIQVLSFFTYMPAVLTVATNNPFTSSQAMIRGGKIAMSFMKNKGNALTSESIFDFGNEEIHEKLIKQGKITREQSDLIKTLYNEGTLLTTQINDFVGADADIPTKSLKGRYRKGWNDFVTAAGFMMRTTEEGSRGAQALAAMIAISDPENLQRIHQNLLENDQYYQQVMQDSLTGEPNKEAIIRLLVEKGLGEYGRESRAAFQNTALAVTMVPFANYPVQMLYNSYEMLSGKYGNAGKMAGLFAISMVGVTAGVWGLPGAMFLKELIETLIRQIVGEDKDLDEELRKWVHNYSPQGLNIDQLISSGVFNAYGGIDVSGRISYDVPLLTEILKMMQGETKADFLSLLGIPGNILGMPAQAIEKTLQGADPLDVLAASVPNVAAQNLYKANVQFPDKGRDYRGYQTLYASGTQAAKENPELDAGSPLNQVKQSLGFKPIAVGEQQRQIDATLRQGALRYKTALDRRREGMKKTFKDILMADYSGDKEASEKARKELQTQIQEMVQFMKDKEIPNPGSSVRSTLRTARIDALIAIQGLEGPAARKKMTPASRLTYEELKEIYGKE